MAKILILGATSRVATEVAQLYAKRSDQLVLIARNENKLERVVESLGHSVMGHAILDATDTTTSQALIRETWAKYHGFDITLIAQGWLGDQQQAEQDAKHAHAILDVNLNSIVAQLIVLQQLYSQQGHGHIAVCSSVAAQRGRPRNFCYGAAKAGLNIYLQGMRSVLWPKVQVHTLLLGPVDTPMTADHEKNFSFSTPQVAAMGIVRAIDNNQARAFIPAWWKFVMTGVRLMPETIFQRLRFLSGR